MKVHCCQLNIVWEDKTASHKRVAALLDAASIEPSSLVVLPEMFATGFTRNVATMHDDETNQSRSFLGKMASRHRCYIAAGLVGLAPDQRGRNLCEIYAPSGHRLDSYQKIHPFTFSGEAEQFEPGNELTSFDWQGCCVCPLVCYDLRFPELFRHGVRKGAQLFAVIANWPSERVEHWTTLLRARAIENQAYVLGVNRCGTDPRLSYPGRSQIIDPRGKILADGGDAECTISAPIDLVELGAYRRSFPALADMRKEFLVRK